MANTSEFQGVNKQQIIIYKQTLLDFRCLQNVSLGILAAQRSLLPKVIRYWLITDDIKQRRAHLVLLALQTASRSSRNLTTIEM